MKRPLGAQISHCLRSRGVDVIFGIPGVHNVEMYRGIEEAGITHVLARHEQGAGFMADGYARATGRTGVAYVITGPGLCNIMTPMGQAASDSVPMLVISSCLDDAAYRRGQLHQMKDQEGAARTVCDWSETARSADQAYGLIDRALAEIAGGARSPKHIQVPIAVLGAEAGPAPAPPAAASAAQDVPEAHIQALADLLGQARRPLFIFGGGAVPVGAQDGAYEPPGWLEPFRALGAASFTTYAARGLLGADFPLHFGAYLAREESAEVIGSADLVVALGTQLSEVDLWRTDLGHSAPLVRVDLDAACLADHHNADVRIAADAGQVMSAVLARLGGGGARDWQPDEVAGHRARWRAQISAERAGIVPVTDVLRDVLPAETMIYSDMTQFAYAAKEVWDMAQPGLWHHPYGFGTLGYALPAAIGGKIGAGARPVVAIAGDYGFHYTMQELGVAVELGLSLPIILWDNAKLGEIEDCMIRGQIAPNAVVARNPDFCALAEAFGAASAAPKGEAALRAAVTEAFAREGPTLIHIGPEVLGQGHQAGS